MQQRVVLSPTFYLASKVTVGQSKGYHINSYGAVASLNCHKEQLRC